LPTVPFRTTIPVRFGDVDHAGIVYYPRFYIYFHEAFEDFFNQDNDAYVQMFDVDRIGFPTVHVETDFKAPLRYGDRLDLDLTIRRVGDRSTVVRFVGYRHRDGELCVTCEITAVCVDLNTFKSRPIPPAIRARLAAFLDPAPSPGESPPAGRGPQHE
jgi:4-hydroxybenzoyl-CoA thioesterase